MKVGRNKKMKKYFRLWQNKELTRNAKNIDDFIEIFESFTQVLKKWKEIGIYLDPESNIEDDQAIFYTTNLQIANEGGFKLDISDELVKKTISVDENMDPENNAEEKKRIEEILDESEIYNSLKINIFSDDDKIEQQFLKEIKAVGSFDTSYKSTIGTSMAQLIYQKGKRYRIQFWLMNIASDFQYVRPTFMRSSCGIIFFYNLNEKIDESLLDMVIKQAMTIIPILPILFVGYDSVLPKNPEKIDQNIQKYFDEFNSLYISVDNPDSMFQILDRIISLNAANTNKKNNFYWINE